LGETRVEISGGEFWHIPGKIGRIAEFVASSTRGGGNATNAAASTDDDVATGEYATTRIFRRRSAGGKANRPSEHNYAIRANQHHNPNMHNFMIRHLF
jgi:hypothetical protein